jgi:hypothetical protein
MLLSHPTRLVRNFLRKQWEDHGTIFLVLCVLPVVVGGVGWLLAPLILPALVYRWSLKGTALLWSPIVWTLRGTFNPTPTQRLRDLRELAVHRVVRGWSLIVLALFVAKVILDEVSMNGSFACDEALGKPLCQQVLVLGSVPPWQLAAVVNAVLAWVLYIAADWLLHRAPRTVTAGGVVDKAFKIVHVGRCTLSFYTIGCSIYLAALLSRRWVLPPLGTKVFPW